MSENSQGNTSDEIFSEKICIQRNFAVFETKKSNRLYRGDISYKYYTDNSTDFFLVTTKMYS